MLRGGFNDGISPGNDAKPAGGCSLLPRPLVVAKITCRGESGCVQMDPHQALPEVARKRQRYPVSPVSSLCTEPGVSQHTSHQRVPKPRCSRRTDGLLRLGRKTEAGNRGHNDIERIFGRTTVFCRIGERPNRLEKLKYRAGPTVSQNQWQWLRALPFDVGEVNVVILNMSKELRVAIQI